MFRQATSSLRSSVSRAAGIRVVPPIARGRGNTNSHQFFSQLRPRPHRNNARAPHASLVPGPGPRQDGSKNNNNMLASRATATIIVILVTLFVDIKKAGERLGRKPGSDIKDLDAETQHGVEMVNVIFETVGMLVRDETAETLSTFWAVGRAVLGDFFAAGSEVAEHGSVPLPESADSPEAQIFSVPDSYDPEKRFVVYQAFVRVDDRDREGAGGRVDDGLKPGVEHRLMDDFEARRAELGTNRGLVVCVFGKGAIQTFYFDGHRWIECMIYEISHNSKRDVAIAAESDMSMMPGEGDY
ncbi:Uu.00g002040.m01.CDS01 [Anthostomella pinea]|uniref:Uu.00g002040.m01.CDS01 n=1 Tax=Anthostomella pinea TaxID=933095 RepID=A0AAI8YIK1_9PEZI|nr:Uu.00g002040.m01.CDS01 [Anthostomella pinea]